MAPVHLSNCMKGDLGYEAQKYEQSLERTEPVEGEQIERVSTHMAEMYKIQNESSPVALDLGRGIVALALIVLYGYLRKKRAIYPGKKSGKDKSTNQKVTKELEVPDACFAKRPVLVDPFRGSVYPSGSQVSDSDANIDRLQKTANGVGNVEQFAWGFSEHVGERLGWQAAAESCSDRESSQIKSRKVKSRKRVGEKGWCKAGSESGNQNATKELAAIDASCTKRLASVDLSRRSLYPSGSSASESDTNTGRLQIFFESSQTKSQKGESQKVKSQKGEVERAGGRREA